MEQEPFKFGLVCGEPFWSRKEGWEGSNSDCRRGREGMLGHEHPALRAAGHVLPDDPAEQRTRSWICCIHVYGEAVLLHAETVSDTDAIQLFTWQ